MEENTVVLFYQCFKWVSLERRGKNSQSTETTLFLFKDNAFSCTAETEVKTVSPQTPCTVSPLLVTVGPAMHTHLLPCSNLDQ